MSAPRALSRSYVCRFGAPVLRAVDPRIFRLRYFRDCLGCGFCHDSCCAYGVDVDLDNVARLKALPGFEAYLGVPAGEWFTEAVVDDPEFPSGRHVRTRVREGACVFRNRTGRGCKLHTYCLETERDYHLFKPMVSILFPVTFELGVLVPSNEVADGSLACAGEGPSCYDGARDELGYYFGAELVGELDAMADDPGAEL